MADTPTTTDPTPQQKKEEFDKKQNETREKLNKSTEEMFTNVKNYLQAELQVASEDYKLIHQMNVITRDKYVEMTATTKTLVSGMTELQERYKAFQPYLDKIDEIDKNLEQFEKTVFLLDEYTKKLEAKFQALQKLRKMPYRKSPLPSMSATLATPTEPESAPSTSSTSTEPSTTAPAQTTTPPTTTAPTEQPKTN